MSVSEDNLICGWLAFSIGLLSLMCSITTLYLIYKMRQWTGYILLVTSLVCCQMFYDVGHILEIDFSFSACMAKKFLNYLGGLSVCVWTLIITYIVLYVTLKTHSLNIYANYKYFFALAVLPSFILAVIVVSGPRVIQVKAGGSCYFQDSPYGNFLYNLYYWTRLVTIALNLSIISFITCWLYSLKPTEKYSRKALAVYTLVNRMKYYPLVQAICRSGAAWNEWQDGRNQSFASYVLASICSPFTGTAYFIVFLIMQPKALATFKSFFPWIFKPKAVLVRDSTVRESDLHNTSMSSMPEDYLHHDNVEGNSNTTVVTSKMGENELEYIINDKNGDTSNPNPTPGAGAEANRIDSSILLSMYSKGSAASGHTRFTISPIQRMQTTQQQSVVAPRVSHHSPQDELEADITRGSECSDGSHYVI